MNKYIEVGEIGDGGDVGGDRQVGTAWERRWQRRLSDTEWEVVTVAVYAVVHDENETPRVHDVEMQTCVTRCTDPEDPGSTDLDTDYSYEFVNNFGYPFLADADAYAKRYCQTITAYAH